MIRKIKSIKGLAVFKNFDWDSSVKDKDGDTKGLTKNNIFYGRNYSGKTTLSRIARALETGAISDKYSGYEFTVELDSNTTITQADYQNSLQNIRVFNEDFIEQNLPFYSDDGVEPFAVLGEDNAKVEVEVRRIKDEELGSDEQGSETLLYKEQVDAFSRKSEAIKDYNAAKKELDDALTLRATGTQTDRSTAIKYKADIYGDQNYDTRKLENDIAEVANGTYTEIDQAKRDELTSTVKETELATVASLKTPELNMDELKGRVKNLVEKEVGQADKIKELVNNAILNKWVQDGMTHHHDDHTTCAFCGNPISDDRWQALEQHFDEESKQLETDLTNLKQEIETEKTAISSIVFDDDDKFYTTFHTLLGATRQELANEVNKYIDDLDALLKQVDTRIGGILVKLNFRDTTNEYKIDDAIKKYNDSIVIKANEYTSSITQKKAEAQKTLRLDNVSEFVKTIDYSGKKTKIAELEKEKAEAETTVTDAAAKIKEKQNAITEKEKELDDKSKGARKVNEYLNHFFGHKYLTLEPITDESTSDKKVKFEIQRNGSRAYHLSEGECSLISFCYFIARLEDTSTHGRKPIVWIDDPISSLDQNHIYFIYSLMKSKVIDADRASQLFVSTHNLDFLRYIKNTKGFDGEDNKKTSFFIVERKDDESAIRLMPEYMRRYVTEFTHIFSQIYACGTMASVDQDNYKEFYGFANNARKFLEMFLFYRYPGDKNEDAMTAFFGDDEVTKSLISKFDNDNSHAEGATEKTMLPYDIAEAHKVARKILEVLKQDEQQYKSLLKSIGIEEEDA